MKTFGVTGYTNQTPSKHFFKKYLSSRNVYKIAGTHLQCMNNHYAKFEYKKMKTI